MRPFPVERFSLRAGRCLNNWYRDANCSRCADSCPVAAISLSEGGARVSDACVYCGVCLRVCPTELFGEVLSPEDQILPRVTPRRCDVWELACPLAQAENGAQKGEKRGFFARFLATGSKKQAFLSQLPEANRLITPRCLGALGVDHLLQIASQGGGQVWLNDAACAECPVGHAWQQMARCVAEANSWLAAFGRPPAVFLASRALPAEAPPPQVKPAVRVAAPQPRRAFFRQLLGLEGEETAVKGYTLRRRQRLLPILASWKPAPAEIPLQGLGVANVQVDERLCSACGLCARACPTGALRFLADEEMFGLLFTAASCVDCGICARICPETAVTFADSMAPDELTAAAPKRLLLGPLQKCPDCPGYIAANSVHEQCFVCRQRKRPLFLAT